MTFKDFWRKGRYINNVMVEDVDGNELYLGRGKALNVKDFNDYLIESFCVERSLLIISVYKEGSEA